MKQLLDLLTWEPNLRMQYEILLMLLLFLVPAAFLRNGKRLLFLWSLVFAGFLLMHRTFFPFVLSGIYVYILCCLCTLPVTASLQAFRLPGIGLRRFADAFFPVSLLQDDTGKKKRGSLYLLAVILSVLLIQLNRINIAVDYDSLRYGLRSPYILLGGKGLSGFFENTGLVNTVYTYSKGFELITLPLSLFSVYISASKSYAYVLCFNIWVLIGILAVCALLAKRLTGRTQAGVLSAFLCALMPGITNMALTAKSDLLTLLCQLIFIYAVAEFIYCEKDMHARSRTRWVGSGLAALIVSYALKPTSMLFSSILGLCALVFLLYMGGKGRKQLFPCISAPVMRIAGPALIFTGICWLRTFLLTGLPVTSVFSGIFSALGFSLKYPFAVQAAPGTETGVSVPERMQLLWERLWRFLFCPSGTDMEHVRMAWGGIVFVLLLLLILLYGRKAFRHLQSQRDLSAIRMPSAPAKTETAEAGVTAWMFLLLSFLCVTVVSLVSLALLYQVDGNYYMLWYALSAVLGVTVLYALSPASFSEAACSRILTLLTASMLYITAFTGWAGAVGFTPSDFEQDRETRRTHMQEGDYALWRLLSETGKSGGNHVIAFAAEPGCYDLRCIVESYTDIAGSGGNVYLVKKLNIFKEYLAFANVDYIYADKEWLSLPGNERASELLRDLVEDGTFTELLYEEDAEALTGSSENGSLQEAGTAAENGVAKSDAVAGARRYFVGKIDPERVKLDWEVPMTEAQQAAAKAALEKLMEE